jgi:hypothetical protein
MQNHHERSATEAEPFSERESEPSATQWRTVAQVAQLLGITPRAIQRRCQAGKYVTRRVDTPKGEAWEIDAASIETTATGTANATATDHERQAEPFGERTANQGERSANDSQSQPDFAARYIAQIEAENRFLKLQIEEGNRNAAELRAALRKAIDAQPRQLTTGTSAAPEVAQIRPQIAATSNTSTDAQTPAESPGKAKGAASRREPRPLWKLLLGVK